MIELAIYFCARRFVQNFFLHNFVFHICKDIVSLSSPRVTWLSRFVKPPALGENQLTAT